MYFDAVVSKETHVVIFNGTSAEVQDWLANLATNRPDLKEEDLLVHDGAELGTYSIKEYRDRNWR